MGAQLLDIFSVEAIGPIALVAPESLRTHKTNKKKNEKLFSLY